MECSFEEACPRQLNKVWCPHHLTMVRNYKVRHQIERENIFQWISSHCCIHGNEQANKLAKEALMLHPPCLLIPLRNAEQLITDKICQKRISALKELTDGKSWSRLLDGQRLAQLSVLPRV
ncbi:hypothetical protein TNCV_1023241 [Trichonephila clavipes]|nr:hypothetical protein TNCV_1023241 [Trichonephila clavipes]